MGGTRKGPATRRSTREILHHGRRAKYSRTAYQTGAYPRTYTRRKNVDQSEGRSGDKKETWGLADLQLPPRDTNKAISCSNIHRCALTEALSTYLRKSGPPFVLILRKRSLGHTETLTVERNKASKFDRWAGGGTSCVCTFGRDCQRKQYTQIQRSILSSRKN